MDDLQRRFRRLDRVATPNLWNEAVGRAAELGTAPRWTFSPSFGLIAAALLLAAMAGTVAIGALLDRSTPDPLRLNYDNGLLTLADACGRVVGIDATADQAREMRSGATDCEGPFGGPEVSPAWSLDGRWLAYLVTNGEPEAGGAWLYDAESGEARHLGPCRGNGCSNVDIAPDGSLVSYLTFDAHQKPGSNEVVLDYGLVLVETASGTEHYLDLPGLAGRPNFSPDGDRIAITLQGGQSGVHVIDVASVLDGELPAGTLVHGLVQATNATWAPNGEWIAAELISHRDPSLSDWGRSTLWIVRPDRTEARQLTTAASDLGAVDPSWSADSSTIAYTATIDGGDSWRRELRTVSVDGGPATPVYDLGTAWSTPPAWSPDGEWIALGVGGDGEDEPRLMIVRPDGTDARLVSDLELAPVWQPIPAD